MIEDQFGDDFEAFGVCGFQKATEVGDGSIVGMNFAVVGDIITVIPKWRGVERQ